MCNNNKTRQGSNARVVSKGLNMVGGPICNKGGMTMLYIGYVGGRKTSVNANKVPGTFGKLLKMLSIDFKKIYSMLTLSVIGCKACQGKPKMHINIQCIDGHSVPNQPQSCAIYDVHFWHERWLAVSLRSGGRMATTLVDRCFLHYFLFFFCV